MHKLLLKLIRHSITLYNDIQYFQCIWYMLYPKWYTFPLKIEHALPPSEIQDSHLSLAVFQKIPRPWSYFKSVHFLGRTILLTKPSTFGSKTYSPVRLKSHDSILQGADVKQVLKHNLWSSLVVWHWTPKCPLPKINYLAVYSSLKSQKKNTKHELWHTALVSGKIMPFQCPTRML